MSYGIDKVRLLVWVDNRAPGERELTGRLCKRHADSLVVPRGWSLDDRREPVPLLFAAAHLVDTSGGTERPEPLDSSKSVRRPRPGVHGNVLPLFDAVRSEPDEMRPVAESPVAEPPVPEAPVAESPVPAPVTDNRAAHHQQDRFDEEFVREPSDDGRFEEDRFDEDRFEEEPFDEGSFDADGYDDAAYVDDGYDDERPVAGGPVEERPDTWDSEVAVGSASDETTSWLQRLAPRYEPPESDDEEPTMGRLMGRAFGRARHPGDGR